MSQSTDTLQAMFDAFNRRDFDGALKHAHATVELRPALTELDVRRRYVGRDEFKQFFQTITDAWESYVLDPEETIEVEDGRILVVERWRARGREGIAFDFQLFDVYTFQDAVVVRVDGFTDRRKALEAVGLAEQEAHADP